MQPRILTLPDSLRNDIERDLTRVFPNTPSKIDGVANAKEIDACEKIVAWHLFGIQPKQPDLVSGASADYKTDPEAKQFLKEFYQAYLGMECGTSSPILQLENLPPKHGRLFNIGLMSHLADGSPSLIGALDAIAPQLPHRDMTSLEVLKQKKVIQSLYCKSPGSVTQPTLFTSVDEALNLLAISEGGDADAARKHWVERLSSIDIEVADNATQPLLSPNPGLEFYDPASPDGRPPEYIMYSRARWANDHNFIDEKDPVKHEQKESDYQVFAAALETAMNKNAATATGSLTANTMLLWNDALVLHGRGPRLGEGVQKNRELEAIEAQHRPHPTDPEGLAHAIGAPCSRVSLEQLMRLDTSKTVNQRTPTP